jgi:8-oxo-dGTP diphosphatase
MEHIYEAPILTVDAVIFQLIDHQLNVMLIKRSRNPFKGGLALPGGYNPKGETTIAALERILRTKSGLDIKKLPFIEQLYTFDTVARDPRGHAVSVVYMGLCRNIKVNTAKASEQPRFVPLAKLPELAFDHQTIIEYAQERLASKATYTNAIFGLLPKEVTLTQLQQAYEAVLGRGLDKRNFRKRILALDLLRPTTKYSTDGAHRPALIYAFRKQSLETSLKLID